MESRLRVQGHPIQPMLVTFPFGLFVSAVVFDLTYLAGGPTFLGEVGYWTVVAALVAAALAAGAGLVDLWDVPDGRTRRTAITFNLVNAGVAVLFVFACLIRSGSPEYAATGVLVAVELLALAVGAVGVWLGAVLVRRFDQGGGEPGSLDTLRPDFEPAPHPHRT
ncbi:DUF2231 domain-containing protein [Micromonospora sp. NBC_01796]|uniref:DUF2231 domain-containing protein n=1 Tax=Micromonospora sp. NBC_01796 TaxID=2975987 RepID=UPI002DDAA3C0|nr:DUF2231 domain-containing protein [Micromonospora sp. NBC_01796]WSA85362.1 DUF2231 domain-containing protein [Micromonospora sp. NBC_01796]